MAPSCPIMMKEFHSAPTLAGELSLIPIEMQTLSVFASRRRAAISGTFGATDSFAMSANRSWFSVGAHNQDHTGNAGMKVSGKALSCAPPRAASRIIEMALAVVAVRSRKTGAAWTAATVTCDITNFPLLRGSLGDCG